MMKIYEYYTLFITDVYNVMALWIAAYYCRGSWTVMIYVIFVDL